MDVLLSHSLVRTTCAAIVSGLGGTLVEPTHRHVQGMIQMRHYLKDHSILLAHDRRFIAATWTETRSQQEDDDGSAMWHRQRHHMTTCHMAAGPALVMTGALGWATLRILRSLVRLPMLNAFVRSYGVPRIVRRDMEGAVIALVVCVAAAGHSVRIRRLASVHAHLLTVGPDTRAFLKAHMELSTMIALCVRRLEV